MSSLQLGLISRPPSSDYRSTGINSPRNLNMDDILSIEEIKSRFPSEWVLIGEPQIDDLTRLRAGRVLFHNPVRDDVDRKVLELRLPYFAVRYFGTLPENMELVL
jgi:hypothetical protein